MSKSVEARDEEYKGWKYNSREEAKKARKKKVNEAAKRYYYRKKAEQNKKQEEKTTMTGEKVITQENNEGNTDENILTSLLKDLKIPGADKALKYLPLALSMVQKLQNKTQQAPQQQNNIPKPPIGYGTMRALDYKHDPAWQAQARAYKEWKIQQGISNMNLTGGYDPTLKGTPTREFEPELKKPNWENPTTNDSSSQAEEGNKTSPTGQEETTSPSSDPATEAYMKEINQQLTFLTDYLNGMKEEQFKEWIKKEEEIKELIKKAPLGLFPGLVTTIKNSNSEELMQVIKENCPEKYEILKKERKIKKAKNLLEEVINAL